MATFFTQRTSIFGRRLGLSSTGGIVSAPSGSTDIDRSAQMWGPGLFSSSTGLVNSGTNLLGGTGGAQTFILSGAPQVGLRCEIISDTSSSSVTINTTDATINFNSSGGTSSTALTFAVAGGTEGQSVVLRGLSATRWQVISRSGGVT